MPKNNGLQSIVRTFCLHPDPGLRGCNNATLYCYTMLHHATDDRNRVRLTSIPGEIGSDYINGTHLDVSLLTSTNHVLAPSIPLSLTNHSLTNHPPSLPPPPPSQIASLTPSQITSFPPSLSPSLPTHTGLPPSQRLHSDPRAPP